MTEEGPPPPKRVCINRDDMANLSKEELVQRWQQQDEYIDSVVNSSASGNDQSDEQLRKQQNEAARRENVLVMRMTTKEQEMQDYLNQLDELKRSQNPSTAHLRDILLDPAINLMFQRMKKEMDVCKEKLEQAQNDLAAWKFTPDGQTGKRLMAKCRMLLQENDELGVNISSGRTAKLEGEVALEKKFVEEMKASQAETDEFLVEMEEDGEGLQSTIYLLQQQLKDAKDQIIQIQTENAQLKNLADMAAERTGGLASGDGMAMETSFEETTNATDGIHPNAHGNDPGMVVSSAESGSSGIIAQQPPHNQMDNTATNAQTIVIQPTTGDNPALRTSVTGNGINHNNESNFSAATSKTDTVDASVERTEQESQHVPRGSSHDNSQEKRHTSREGTPTLEEQNKMDTSETYAEKHRPQDNGYLPTAAATNSYSSNCHDSSTNADHKSKSDIAEAFKDGGDKEIPERTATPTMDDSSDQRTVSDEQRTLNSGGAKGEGIVVTKDNNKELVQNGLIGTQYDSSQDEM